MLGIDPVLAEYITIMVINNKTPGTDWLKSPFSFANGLRTVQITSELEECGFIDMISAECLC